MMKKIFIPLTLSFCTSLGFAADYIAVNKEGKVFDQANGKYVTENQEGSEVSVIPGMIFSTTEHVPGWYKIEYSPGLHAFIPEQIVASNFNAPKPGNYSVKNNPSQSVTVQNDGNGWSVVVNGKTYNGNIDGDIVIFFDESGNVAFSLVDLGQGGIVITYDNVVTKFF